MSAIPTIAAERIRLSPVSAAASVSEPRPIARRAARSPRTRSRRRYHLHRPGLVYIAVTLFMAVGAINSQNNLLFAALGLAIGGLLVSGFISGGALMGMRVSRTVPAQAFLGEPFALTVHTRNVNRLTPAFGLHVVEQRTDRELGVEATWPAFCDPPESFLVQVPARSAVDARMTVLPRRRGRLTFGPLRLWTNFPFGLVRKSVTFALPQSTIVYPAVLPLRPGALRRLMARAPVGQGSERAPGPGDEFFGLREYVPGDSLRRIAWKRSARTGDLIVRQNAVPSPQRMWVIIRLLAADASGSQRLNERAIALGASLMRAAADAGMAVGLAVPGTPVALHPRLGRAHSDRLLQELAFLETATLGPQAFPEAASRLGACAVVHAGDVDQGFAPRHATHFAAALAERDLAPGERTSRVLALLDHAGEAPGSRGGLRAWLGAIGRFMNVIDGAPGTRGSTP